MTETKASPVSAKPMNVQPGMLVKLMALSEPCLFRNQSPVAAIPTSLPPELVVMQALMMDAARWHAQLQVSFDRILARELAGMASS